MDLKPFIKSLRDRRQQTGINNGSELTPHHLPFFLAMLLQSRSMITKLAIWSDDILVKMQILLENLPGAISGSVKSLNVLWWVTISARLHEKFDDFDV
jgi:hypothetical protein